MCRECMYCGRITWCSIIRNQFDGLGIWICSEECVENIKKLCPGGFWTMQDSVPMWVYEYKKKRVKEMLKNLAKGHHQITGKYINSKPMIVSPHDKK